MTARITFESLSFHDRKNTIRVHLLNHFYFELDKESLKQIGNFSIPNKYTLCFKEIPQKNAEKKFSFLLSQHINELKSIRGNTTATYIHKHSGIPLMGCLPFGIADKGTNILEIKPITGCNMGCVFCSVDEGIGSKKSHDFVVEKDYLVEETEKLLDFKKHKDMLIYINAHGEPLLYGDLVGLVKDLKQNKWIKEIHVITNGTLLTKDICKQLNDAGLTHLNISVSAFDDDKAKEIMGSKAYQIKHIKEITEFIKKQTNIEVMITPVVIFGMNDQEMEKIIIWAKQQNIEKICIQNFLFNRRGRNPAKEKTWDHFKKFLGDLEKKHDVKLLFDDLKLEKTKEYPKPFKRGDIIKAEIICRGRYANERIAVAKERCIFLPKVLRDFQSGNKVKVKITKSNHNIFVGEVVKKG